MPNLQPVKQMMQVVRNSNNPEAMINMLAESNPQLKQALDIIRQAGNNPERAFYALCEQKGIDPQQILDALK